MALGLSNIRFKTGYRLLYFMPVVTSTVAVSVVWLYLLNNDFGIINTNVKAWTGIELPNWLVDSRWVMPSIAVIGIWQGLGYSMVIFLAGLANIPVSVKEAAQIDGANKFQIFRNVTLPLLVADDVLPDHHRAHRVVSSLRSGVCHDRWRAR